jgi:hypothetical protein
MPTEAYALSPMPYARRVPHVTEKGYIRVKIRVLTLSFIN